MLDRIAGSAVSRRELRLLLAAMALGLAIRVAFVLLTREYTLGPDEIEYVAEGRFIEAGQWFWTTVPYGNPHAGFWKAPGYPAFVGVIFSTLGIGVTRLLLVQTLLGPLTIFLTWVLARRLFVSKPNVALGAALIFAVYPNAWQWETRVTAEALATPLTALALILVLARPPTARRAAVIGIVVGLGLLVRPTAFLLLAGVVAAYVVSAGWRRGGVLAAVSLAAAILVVAPWTIRNYNLTGGEVVPISVQDAAAYGTFNDDAANDADYPWAWRPRTTRDQDILTEPRSDADFRSALIGRAREYVLDNPASIPQAFFWNGLIRTWDLRSPSKVLFEAPFEGRSKPVAAVGLALYWVLIALAITTLWRQRARRELWAPVLALALATSIVFTVAAATRYRAPLEPLIVVLASASLPWLARPGTGPGAVRATL